MSSPEHALDPHQRPLPTPRAFLTSLMKSLSTTPSTTSGPSGEAGTGTRERTLPPSNPLSTLPASQKSLLATLHVLFPPPTLLQALDLLDRGLVTRIHVSSTDETIPPHAVQEAEDRDDEGQDSGDGEELQQPQATGAQRDITTTREKTNKNTNKERYKNTFYTVRSAQSRPPHHRHGTTPSTAPGLVYTVHMHAWSCSCAAFTFAAFPPLSPSRPSSPSSSSDDDADADVDIGGLSLEGEDAGIPICKHLLACLLAERWEDGVGAYVDERRVSREEAGGICAA